MSPTFLAEFELYTTLAVARLGEDAYGASIRREIEGTTGRPVSVGALYATLGRLEEKGLLVAEESEPEPGRRGRPRKYVRLTPEGVKATRHSAEMLGRMMEGVSWASAAGSGGS